MHWGLRGRLVFGDGTELISDQVYNHINNNVVKYINTFETMPTAEQWATLTTVQTLNTSGNTGQGYSSTLYWRANSTYPMKIIITFLEEPPVKYAPEVLTFQVARVNEAYQPDDEGLYAATTLQLALGDASAIDTAECRIYYAANAYPIVGQSEYIDLTSRINELMTGLNLNTTLLNGQWGVDSAWYFAVVFLIGDENAVSTSSIPRAKGSLHVSGYSAGGVCVCGYSKGTTDNPLFESYAPAHFYEPVKAQKGIEGVTNYTLGEIETGGRWIDGKKIYRFVMVANVTSKGDVTLGTIPSQVENLIFSYCSLKDNSGNVFRPVPYAYHGSLNWATNFRITADGSVIMQLGSSYGTNQTTILIFEYTKTTEEAS